MVYNTKSCLDFAHARSVRNWLELLHTVLCLSIYLTTFLLNFLVHIVNHPRYQLACIASCYQSPRIVLPNPKVIQLRYPKLFKVFFLGTLVPSFCPRWTDLLLLILISYWFCAPMHLDQLHFIYCYSFGSIFVMPRGMSDSTRGLMVSLLFSFNSKFWVLSHSYQYMFATYVW